MEAAVERPDVGLRQAWQKVSPWLVAFFTQWLILTLAVVLYRVIEIAFILHFINPAFDKDQFLLVGLFFGCLFYILLWC